MKLAVIIPTYNRSKVLFSTLFALHDQTLNQKDYEIILVDDGSTDDTKKLIKDWEKEFNFQVKYFYQKNQKQGAARNLGLKKTKAKYVLFLGDDIIPNKSDFLEIHLDALEKSDQKTAFLGFTTWHVTIMPSRFNYWLEHGGPQFDYRGLYDGKETDFWHFYTSNISLPRELLEKEQFDTGFGGYGYEDIELAYRLVKKHGMKVIFLSKASAGHQHELSEEGLFRRIPQMRKGAEYFEKKHPEVSVLPKGIKRLVLYMLTRKPVIFVLNLFRKECGWYLRFKREMVFG